MNVIAASLELVPVPYLAAAFVVLQTILQAIERYEQSKLRLQALAECIAQLLRAIDSNARNDESYPSRYRNQLDELEK
jgi:hypothetical protein